MLNQKLSESESSLSKSNSSITHLEQLIETQQTPLPVPPQVKAFRFLRLVMSFGAVAVISLIAIKHYSQVRSRQAFVNAEIVSVRNPIAGNLKLKNLQPGQAIASGENIGAVENLRQGMDLEVTKQSLISKIEQAKQTLVNLDAQIVNRRQLIAQVQAEASNHKGLGIDYEVQQVEIAQNQVNQALFAAKTAQKEINRLKALHKQGVIAQDKVERSQLNYNRAQNAVKSMRSQLKQAQQKVEAAKAGLQLEGSKTLGYSDIRQRELHVEIDDLQLQQAQVQVSQKTSEAELVKIDRQLELNQQAMIISPTKGTIWSVESKSGEYANPSTPILELLNCQNRWVEAFFSEQNTDKLYPGKSVAVRLLGAENSEFVRGTIESVRAGSGRIKTGQDIAVPPPDNVRRQVAVRIRLNKPPNVNSVQFCDVGRSAEVVFEQSSQWSKISGKF